MAKKVELLINGSPYSVWCKEEDENKIFRLGTELEGRMSKIARSLRPESEAHALFLISLLLLSEVEEKERKGKDAVDKIEQEVMSKNVQEETYKQEIHALKTALEIAKTQVTLLADRTEKILGEVKETLKEKV